MHNPESFDLIVIGSGGGLMVALAAAQRNMKVALIERGAMGGTCLNRGCIPSKMLIYPGELADEIREADRINISVAAPQVNFSSVIERTARQVAEIRQELETNIARYPSLERITAVAKFESNKVLRAGERRLTAPRILVATGAEPDCPDIPGLADVPYMTSTEALTNPTCPERLLVIGAGYIAVELGYAYGAAGSDVQLLVRSRFLRHEDDEIAAEFTRLFADQHTCHMGYKLRKVSYDGKTYSLDCVHETEGERIFAGDALLVATGVRPLTSDLGLDLTDVQVDKSGFVVVDSSLETDVPGVYALGDVAGNYQFRHTANYEARYLIRSLVEGQKVGPLDYGPVPHAIFSRPEIAGVGLREQDVADRSDQIVIGRTTFAESNAGIARGLTSGFAKILVQRSDHKLLGCHIMGDEAATLLHMMIPLLKTGATLDDMLDLIFIHPALSEILRDAARDAQSQLK
ncbi:MAG: dihydrolipoyl dehydrogenase [Kiritimatiellae bacterium]|jgi:mycothione reductase|nr:dihydrolipoyl dehydrogenase [Kiritimatiellia bacterium]